MVLAALWGRRSSLQNFHWPLLRPCSMRVCFTLHYLNSATHTSLGSIDQTSGFPLAFEICLKTIVLSRWTMLMCGILYLLCFIRLFEGHGQGFIEKAEISYSVSIHRENKKSAENSRPHKPSGDQPFCELEDLILKLMRDDKCFSLQGLINKYACGKQG